MGPSILIEELIYEPEHSLIDQSHHAIESKSAINADGVGVGWYSEWPDPGLYRQIQPAWNDTNLKNLARHVRSHLFFAHVRASTGTDVTIANCHPFSSGHLMFMHNGQVRHYDKVRRAMEAAIPDKVYANRCGTTDSESLFLMMHAYDVEEDPIGAYRKTIQSIEQMQRDAGLKPDVRITAVLSDGKSLTAVRYATNIEAPTLYWADESHQLTLASEPFEPSGDNWKGVPDNHALHVKDGNIRTIEALF